MCDESVAVSTSTGNPIVTVRLTIWFANQQHSSLPFRSQKNTTANPRIMSSITVSDANTDINSMDTTPYPDTRKHVAIVHPNIVVKNENVIIALELYLHSRRVLCVMLYGVLQTAQ